MTRRRFLALFGGFLAAVTAAFPALRRPKTGLTVAKLREAKAILEGTTVHGVWYDETLPIYARHKGHDFWAEPGSNVLYYQKTGNQCGKTNAARAEIEAMIRDAFYHGNRLEL